MTYTLHSDKTWRDLESDLARCFERWSVREWSCDSPGRLLRTSKYGVQATDQRTAWVEWKPRGSAAPIRLTLDDQARAVDNLHVLWLAIDAMRLNEKRGIGRVIQEAYAQLSAPVRIRPWYEVLQVQPDADLEVVDASYRSLAKRLHPDVGGSNEAMAELNTALACAKAPA